jgi:hypothetical protein
MRDYTGNDPAVNSGSYFALPSECHRFLAKGGITTFQYFIHRNKLIAGGLWRSEYEMDAALKNTIGGKFFHLMANLDINNFRELVSMNMNAKQTVNFMDYPEECRLRKLLEKEKDDGLDAVHARKVLGEERAYYRNWKDRLFGVNYTFKEEKPSTVETVTQNGTLVSATSGGGRNRVTSIGIFVGIVIYLGI